ncbi:MAG: ABC transporter ATP-binding protein [Actinomycetota bacterium]
MPVENKAIDQISRKSSHPGPAIEVVNLQKRYGEVAALGGVSFEVAPGEIFGLLGHNGAGKSTLIRILTGRTRATAGHVRVQGLDVHTDLAAIKPIINVVFEEQNLYDRLTAREQLRFFADLYEAPSARVDVLLRDVGLLDAADRRVKDYSTGMRQRLLLARALLNEPRVLFLDEPTRGLDPESVRNLRGIIAELARAGTTVLLTTHDMVEVDELCDRVAFLVSGRIAVQDDPRELKLRSGRRELRVLLDDRSEHVLALDSPDHADRLRDWMAAARVAAVHSAEATLAEVFIDVTGRSLDDDPSEGPEVSDTDISQSTQAAGGSA